jgi:hypothetical protein
MLTMSQSLQMRFVTVLDSTHEDRSTWKRFGESVKHDLLSPLTIDLDSISHEPSAPALVRFSRPHTVFGTMVSCNKEVKWTFQLLIVIG